jgi:hypothetical protein
VAVDETALRLRLLPNGADRAEAEIAHAHRDC